MINRKELKGQRLGGGLGDHLGLSWTCSYCGLVGQQSLKIEKYDRKILRELARQVAEIASRPGELYKKSLWKKHNSLEETAPLVFCDPELAWYELIPLTAIRCRGSLARIWEFRLKKEIYWGDIIKDDRVILPEFTVHRVFTETSRGIDRKLKQGGNGGSYAWDPAIKDYEDLERLRPKKIIADEARTSRLLELAREVFGGILEVKLESSYWWSFGMTEDLIMLRGFENILIDMYDNPGLVHRLMTFLRDENIKKLDFFFSSKKTVSLDLNVRRPDVLNSFPFEILVADLTLPSMQRFSAVKVLVPDIVPLYFDDNYPPTKCARLMKYLVNKEMNQVPHPFL